LACRYPKIVCFHMKALTCLTPCFCAAALARNDSFRTVYYDANTRCIESTICRVSSWTASNLFSLIPSKTGFLFIGPSQNILNNLILSVSFMSLETSVMSAPIARNLGVVYVYNISTVYVLGATTQGYRMAYD
jgi:hypothetical protein